MTRPHSPDSPDVLETAPREGGYMDWGAIIAGALIACATAFVLLTFGAAIGLSITSFEPGEGVSLSWISIATGLWFLWVALTAIGAGGYIAGRMRRPVALAVDTETDTRDGVHGLTVWGGAVLLSALLSASGIGGLASMGGSVAGSAATAATEAVSGNLDMIGSRLTRGADTADAERIATEAVSLLQASLADGELSTADTDYLVATIAETTGRSEAEARSRVEEARTQAVEAYDTALAAAEQVRFAAAIAAFVIAASLVSGAAVGWFAATTGGAHRDRARPFGTLFQ